MGSYNDGAPQSLSIGGMHAGVDTQGVGLAGSSYLRGIGNNQYIDF